MWSDNDQAGSGRDQESADADQRAADADFAAGGDVARYLRGVLVRSQSRRNRGSVAESRDKTSAKRLLEPGSDSARDEDRLLAERDRALAADDRVEAADDRQQAARDRAEALRSSGASAIAAERALETLESMSDAFFTLDSQWRFTYLNPQCEVILERRREDLLGKSMWVEFEGGVGSNFDREYRRAFRDQVPVRFEEFYEPLGRTLEIRAYPIGDGLAVYFTDVTHERLRDAKLRQTQRLEMLGQLTAGVAHDFSNLLFGIGVFARQGLAESADETLTSYFQEIDLATQRAVALTRQLLAFGREQELSPKVVDLNDVVESLSSLLRQLMPKGIRLQTELSAQPVIVLVDPSQLEQVLVNLVVNSRDSIDATGSITVSTATNDPAGPTDRVAGRSGWLQVTDTGSGIPGDVLPFIFDPFFTTKAPETGTGLGLATIYGIVSQSGGSVFVDSQLDVGTIMTIALPAHPPDSDLRDSETRSGSSQKQTERTAA